MLLLLLLLLPVPCTTKNMLSQIGRGSKLDLRDSQERTTATYFRWSRRRGRQCQGGRDRQYHKGRGRFQDLGSAPGASNHETREKTAPEPTTGRKSPPPSDTPSERRVERSDSKSMTMSVCVKLPPWPPCWEAKEISWRDRPKLAGCEMSLPYNANPCPNI